MKFSKDWLQDATAILEGAGVNTARLDALILLEDVTGRDRAWLLAHPEHELSAAQTVKLEKLLNQRVGHEPLAYIRGKAEFYGREFVLTPAVLQPRPESETMIDALKALSLFHEQAVSSHAKTPQKRTPIAIADVGAGSGALGITAQLELPETTVQLLEIDPAALKIAKTNVDKFTLTIPTLKTDLLEGSAKEYDVLLCNLPYVPDDFHINQAASKEPSLAIFGGPDGLNLYRKLFQQIQQLSNKPLYILTESLPPQHQALKDIAKQAGYRLAQTNDFIQVFLLPKISRV